MNIKNKAVAGGVVVAALAVVLGAVAFRGGRSDAISVSFVGLTNIGPANASAAMYVVTNHGTGNFTFVGFKFLVRTNLHWVEEPRPGTTQIPWKFARLLSGSFEGNGHLPAGSSFHVFLPGPRDKDPRKVSLCFIEERNPPVRWVSSNPSLFQGLREEAETKWDAVLGREFDCPVPDPVK